MKLCLNQYGYFDILNTIELLKWEIMSKDNIKENSIVIKLSPIMSEWDYSKNDIDPREVSYGSTKKYWWRCDKNHSWKASPNSRTLKKNGKRNGCPICSGRQVIPGETDFGTKYPQYVPLWDEDKNEKAIFETSSTQGTVYLICNKGHEYSLNVTSIARRKDTNPICTVCSGSKIIEGVNDFATHYPDFVQYVDKEKKDPQEFFYGFKNEIPWKCDKGHKFNSKISIALKNGQFHCPYCENRILLKGYNDVLTVIGDRILEMWSHTNKKSPSETLYKEASSYYFICNSGHAFSSQVSQEEGIQCPYCLSGNSHKKSYVIPGVNDFSTTHPHLAKMISKNSPVQGNDVTYGSKRKIIITCDKGHEYSTTPKALSARRTEKCLVCQSENNNIFTVFPDLLDRIDLSKNSYDDVKYMTQWSKKSRIWLKCEMGHSWDISPGNIEKWGGCPYCSSQRVLAGFNDVATTQPEILKMWNYDKNDDLGLFPTDFSAHSKQKVWWICENNHEYESSIHNRSIGYGCPVCVKTLTTSKMEKELLEYISNILPGEEIIDNDRTILSGKELDIFIPDKKIAIEFNGIYWHNEDHVGKKYHYDKWKECKEKGVQLITIWEDEWEDKKDIVKDMLSHKLNVSHQETVYARNTVIKEISFVVSKEFLHGHHIQSGCNGSVYYGLYHDNDLIAVSVWSKNGDSLYLDRYATSCRIPGGMGKMLKYGKKYALKHGCNDIVTFADHCVSNGGIYEKLGFIKEKEIPADYKYVKDGKRYHKFGYRIQRFENDDSLLYYPGYTEKELADMNGLYRIWDAGKDRYVLNLEK